MIEERSPSDWPVGHIIGSRPAQDSGLRDAIARHLPRAGCLEHDEDVGGHALIARGAASRKARLAAALDAIELAVHCLTHDPQLTLDWAFSPQRLSGDGLRNAHHEWRKLDAPPLFALIALGTVDEGGGYANVVRTTGLRAFLDLEIDARVSTTEDRLTYAQLVGWAARNALVSGALPSNRVAGPHDVGVVHFVETTDAQGGRVMRLESIKA